MKEILLDCTLRDGGYYNQWNFSKELVSAYFEVMDEINIDIVEVGFRSIKNNGFKGPYAYSQDEFLDTLTIPKSIKLGVMINASEIIENGKFSEEILNKLFPKKAKNSKVSLVRVAAHFHELSESLKSVSILRDKGYIVGFNLMQIAQYSNTQIESAAEECSEFPIDVLYFADSFGSLLPENIEEIIKSIRKFWISGPLGIHTHDNMGYALKNTLVANDLGVSWLDSTITGMGRGPGNSKTEELINSLKVNRVNPAGLISITKLVNRYFKPLQLKYEWGSNTYYFLSGKYGIHPSYIQKMIGDIKYDENDIIGVIHRLKKEGSRKYSLSNLNSALNFFDSEVKGSWSPKNTLKGKEVLILGTGPGILQHKDGIENFIKKYNPIVLGLNTQNNIDQSLINMRVACHPTRLLADYKLYEHFSQPMITPYSMLPDDVKSSLDDKKILDFGIQIQDNEFEFKENSCSLPSPLVMAYSFAIASSGECSQIFLAGFDGYDDVEKNSEMDNIIKLFKQAPNTPSLTAITPSKYNLEIKSVYGF
tara:strand:+ start:772 stop:2379 length:1608 start_codon:yes stop_codon:yes gene_type:complete